MAEHVMVGATIVRCSCGDWHDASWSGWRGSTEALREALERAMAAVESLPILPTRKHNRAISEAHHALADARAALGGSRHGVES